MCYVLHVMTTSSRRASLMCRTGGDDSMGKILLNDSLRGAETRSTPLDEDGERSGLRRRVGMGGWSTVEGRAVDGRLTEGRAWLPTGLEKEIVTYALGYGEGIEG